MSRQPSSGCEHTLPHFEQDNDKKRGAKKKAKNVSWQSYIHKVLKTVHEEDCTLSKQAMLILDSFANDLFDRTPYFLRLLTF